MGFQFRGWPDKMWRIMVYLLIAISLIVFAGWYAETQLGYEFKLWRF